jgi:hypothetical protein
VSLAIGTPLTGATTHYNFTFVLDHDVPDGGVLEIAFPANYYKTGLGLPSPFDCYLPYPTKVA